jgi:hypothetical protein
MEIIFMYENIKFKFNSFIFSVLLFFFVMCSSFFVLLIILLAVPLSLQCKIIKKHDS